MSEDRFMPALWISVFLTIAMVGLQITGWWISALTTLFLLVLVLGLAFRRSKEHE